MLNTKSNKENGIIEIIENDRCIYYIPQWVSREDVENILFLVEQINGYSDLPFTGEAILEVADLKNEWDLDSILKSYRGAYIDYISFARKNLIIAPRALDLAYCVDWESLGKQMAKQCVVLEETGPYMMHFFIK